MAEPPKPPKERRGCSTTLLPLLTFLLGLVCGLAWGQNPAGEVRAALADARTLPNARAVRYFSLYSIDEKERAAVCQQLSFVVNSVSRAATIRNLRTVGPTLVAIDLGELAIPAANWESLVSDNEPYFHITTKVVNPQTGKVETVYTDGGWIDLADAAQLRAVSGSGGAVVRADWFIAKATAFKHYYQLAGVPSTLGEFYQSLGLDAKTIVGLNANHGANVFVSGVTKKPRRLSRWQGPHGASWQTYDAAATTADNDPFRNPTFTGAFDASEHIAAKANGLHLFALFDGSGKRQDTVPDKIAKDDSDPHADGVLQPMVSCVRCHKESGLRPFENDQRKLLASATLLTNDPREADRLASFYTNPKLDRGIVRDREDYADAVARATGGMKVEEVAEGLAKIVREYEFTPVTRDVAMRELATASVGWLNQSKDPIILAVRAGIPVSRTQWESAVAESLLLSSPEWKR